MSEKKLYVISHHETTVRRDLKDRKHVYESGADCYKIGVADDPKKRLSTLGSGTPNRLRLETVIESSDAKAVESELHNHFYERNKTGEWFELLTNDLNSLRGLKRIEPGEISNLTDVLIRSFIDAKPSLYVAVKRSRQEVGADE